LQPRQLSFAILAAVLALPAFAGCGGSGDPLHTARKAAKTTLGLTAQTTMSFQGSTLFGGRPGTIVGRAQFSFPRGLGYAAIDVPALGPRAAGRAYLVYLPTRLWAKPVVSTELPQGDLWVSARFTGPHSGGSATPPIALVLESMNPQLLLEEIASGAVAARSSGHRVVDHVPFAEYVVSVDLVQALKTYDKAGALRTGMQQQLAALRANRGTSLVRIVVGVDGTGRIAQLDSSPVGAKLGRVHIALWRFGSPIPLSLPLTSETVDVPSLQRSHGAVTPAWMLLGS
jgi:hypothetical protein